MTSRAAVAAKEAGELAVATLIATEEAQEEVAMAQAVVVDSKAREAIKLRAAAMALVAMAEDKAAQASSKATITLLKEAVMKVVLMTGAVVLLKKPLHPQEQAEVVVSLVATNKEISKIKATLKAALAISNLSYSHLLQEEAPNHPIRFSSRTFTVTTLRMT